jgi:endonuclease-3
MAEILHRDYNGEVPLTVAELVQLPGVGRKTANVITSVIDNQPNMAVDTHVFRVSNRTGLTKGKNPNQVEEQLLKILPSKYLKKAHHLILLHGRYICKSRSPHCAKCVINKICLYKDKNV